MKPLETAQAGAKVGFEIAKFPLCLAAAAGKSAVKFAAEVYAGKPLDKSHLAEQIQAEIVVTDVEVTRQALAIAKRDKWKAETVMGLAHAKLTQKLFEVESDEAVDDSVKERVVKIVQDAGTDPMRVDDSVLPEIQRRHVKNILSQDRD